MIFFRNFQQVICRMHSSFEILYAEICGLQQIEYNILKASVMGSLQL